MGSISFFICLARVFSFTAMPSPFLISPELCAWGWPLSRHTQENADLCPDTDRPHGASKFLDLGEFHVAHRLDCALLVFLDTACGIRARRLPDLEARFSDVDGLVHQADH